jgi:ISXO2-like transposase domain
MHRVASLCKRWLRGTYRGCVEPKHLPGYLNEFVFRFRPRTSRHRGLLFFLLRQLALDHDPVRYRELVTNPEPKKKPPRPPTHPSRTPSVARPPVSTDHGGPAPRSLRQSQFQRTGQPDNRTSVN